MGKRARENASTGRIVRYVGAKKEAFEAFDRASDLYCQHAGVALARLMEWFSSQPETVKRDILAPLPGEQAPAVGPASKDRRAG